MPIDKLVPRVLNLDDDERLVQSNQMTDALNVRVSVDDDNDAGVVKQSYGNAEVLPRTSGDALPAGVNQVIGSVNYDTGGVVFYFVWNSNGDHCVMMYSSKENDFVKLYEGDDNLDFERYSHIQADVAKMGNGETLLYFTDGITEPKKLNVDRLLSNTYDGSLNTTDGVSNAVTVCKRPPMLPPTMTFQTTGEHDAVANRIVNNVFQFACQYVYVDGEVSAIGPYSKLSYYEDHFNPTGTMDDLYGTVPDSIIVKLDKARHNDDDTGTILDGDIKGVRFLARAGNTGSWYVFAEEDTAYTQSAVISTFTNSKAYRLVGEQDTNKLYDAVPRAAKTLCISDNRLFFGNYVDGFDVNWDVGKDAYSHSFPVTTGITTADTIGGGLDLETSADYGQDNEHAYYTLKFESDQNSALRHLEPSHSDPNAVSTGADLGDANSNSGYFVYQRENSSEDPAIHSGDTEPMPWAIRSLGSGVGPATDEPSLAIGIGAVKPIEVAVDMSFIPNDGFGFGGNLELTWEVTGGKCWLVPNKEDDTGMATKQVKFKPFPPNTEGPEDLSAKTQTIELFQAGDNTSSASDFNNPELYGRMEVSGVGIIETPDWSHEQSVIVNINGGDTKDTIIQKIQDKIFEGGSSTEFSVSGRPYVTAHGNPYSRSLTFLNEVEDQKACRYLLTTSNIYGGGNSEMCWYAASSFESGNNLVIQYRGKRAKFMEMDRIGHAGPVTFMDSNIFGFTDQPKGLDTITPLLSDPVSFQRGDTGDFHGIDGAPFGTQADVYRTMIEDWMLRKTVATATFTQTVGGGADAGMNRLTFRSGAHHPLGIVFYDHRNRSSSVNVLPEAYVPFSGSPESVVGNEVNQLVPYDVDVAFPSSRIPDWAERYQVVYPGNSVYEWSLTTTVAEALVADMSRVVIRDPSFGATAEVSVDEFDDATSTDADAESTFPSMAVAEAQGIRNEGIYVSMRFFEGKTDSYKESKSAQLQYEYRPGDKLRIVSYAQSGSSDATTIYPANHFFDIVGYRYFEPNSERNVLQLPNGDSTNFTEEGEYRRSGWFLILRGEDANYPGFRTDDLRNSNSNVNKWYQDCRVEILRPRIQPIDEEIVYYEIGESYHVEKDSKDDVDYSEQVPVAFTEPDVIQTKQRLFIGDSITPAAFPSENPGDAAYFGGQGPPFEAQSVFTDGGSRNQFRVERVIGRHYNEAGEFEYYEYRVSPSTIYEGEINATGLLNNFVMDITVFGTSELEAVASQSAECIFQKNPFYHNVHLTNQGDTYFRQRTLRQSAVDGVNNFDPGQLDESTDSNYVTRNVEDPGFNDFLKTTVTQHYHYGRPHIYSADFRTNLRFSSITYSDVYASDGELLGLSSFNPSLYPFKDYSLRNGSIQRMYDGGAKITVLQERKVSITPVSRDYIQTAEGGMLITSNNVLGAETYYQGDHGPGIHSRGIVEHDGRIYFADIDAGVVVMVGGNGVNIISNRKADSYFKDNFQALQDAMVNMSVSLSVHPDNNELIVSFQNRVRRKISAGGTEFGRGLPVDLTSDSKFILEPLREVHHIPGSPLDIANESQDWGDAILNWEDSGKGVIFVDHPRELGFVDANIKHSDNNNFLVTTNRNEFYGKMLSRAGERTGELVETADAGSRGGSPSTITKGAVTTESKDTIAYDINGNVWTTKYSFIPEDMTHTFEDLLSFNNGVPYLHSDAATINNFYGTKYNSKITLISKVNPSMVKHFKALSLEGNSVWSAALSNSEQSSSITTTMWREQSLTDGSQLQAGSGFREGMLYCHIPGDTSANSHLDEITLGTVDSTIAADAGPPAVDAKIVFDSNINRVPFNIGDKIYKDDGTDTGNTITGVHKNKELLVSGLTGISADDVLVARPAVDTGHITGDRLRDYYLKIELTNGESTRTELYAVNTYFDRSRLHNDRVN